MVDLERQVTLREVLDELHRGFGWPDGSPEHITMVETAELIETKAKELEPVRLGPGCRCSESIPTIADMSSPFNHRPGCPVRLRLETASIAPVERKQ